MFRKPNQTFPRHTIQKTQKLLSSQWINEKGCIPEEIDTQIEKLARDASIIGIDKIDQNTFENLGSTLIETILNWNSNNESTASNTWLESPAKIINEYLDNPEAVDQLYKDAVLQTINEENLDILSNTSEQIEEIDKEPTDDRDIINKANSTIAKLNEQIEEMGKSHRDLQRDYELLKEGQESMIKDFDDTIGTRDKMQQQIFDMKDQMNNYLQLKEKANKLETELHLTYQSLRHERSINSKMKLKD